jgi:predicted DNA-binding antitoxin AbrB/MazE fold protein
MSQIIEAIFDGQVLQPAEPVELAPDTRVRLTIEAIAQPEGKTPSFLRTARALNLEGPEDWSSQIEAYLYDYEHNSDS